MIQPTPDSGVGIEPLVCPHHMFESHLVRDEQPANHFMASNRPEGKRFRLGWSVLAS